MMGCLQSSMLCGSSLYFLLAVTAIARHPTGWGFFDLGFAGLSTMPKLISLGVQLAE